VLYSEKTAENTVMAAHNLERFHWKPGESGNPAGRPRKPRRSLDAVQRLESLGVDPLEEVVALAQDSTLPKPLRLKAWLTLCEYAYPKLAPVVPNERVSTTLAELQLASTWPSLAIASWRETTFR
jgi:Family of unknown function (DUF5681)